MERRPGQEDAFARVRRAHWGSPCEWYASVPSTNHVALEHAGAGAPEGLVVVADVQEAGRGQRGNTWSSPAGGLWFSLVLRPQLASAEVAELMPRAGEVVAAALRDELGVPATVKHPNDVLVEGRKLVGILAEAATRAGEDHPEHVVLGIGLNVTNELPPELAATATRLADWCPPPPRAQVLALLLASLEAGLLP